MANKEYLEKIGNALSKVYKLYFLKNNEYGYNRKKLNTLFVQLDTPNEVDEYGFVKSLVSKEDYIKFGLAINSTLPVFTKGESRNLKEVPNSHLEIFATAVNIANAVPISIYPFIRTCYDNNTENTKDNALTVDELSLIKALDFYVVSDENLLI
jgi:hypothetical protein